MQLKPEEISKVIRSQIKYYDNAIKQNETGTVLMVGDGIARASGLINCMAGELLEFEDGSFGIDIVNEVQQYVDPDSLGLGGGCAPIGAHFTAAAAESEYIDISVTIEVKQGFSFESAKESIKSGIENYFKTQVMNSSDAEEIMIRISEIGAVISDVTEIADYRNLVINGSDENIAVNAESVPILGVTEIEAV